MQRHSGAVVHGEGRSLICAALLHWGFVHALVSVITPLAMVLVTDVTRRRDSVADAETLWTMGKIGHWKREKRWVVGGKLGFKAYIHHI